VQVPVPDEGAYGCGGGKWGVLVGVGVGVGVPPPPEMLTEKELVRQAGTTLP